VERPATAPDASADGGPSDAGPETISTEIIERPSPIGRLAAGARRIAGQSVALDHRVRSGP